METNNIKDYEDCIGKQVKGFKFDSRHTCAYASQMDNYIGVVGTIVEWDSDSDIFGVEFRRGVIWYYPADLVIKQLEQKEELIDMMEKDEESGVYDDDSEPECGEDVLNPSHYSQYKIQPIDYIEANSFDFFEGNVIKYVSRYKQKNGLEDLLKAKVYLEKLINRYGV